MLAFKDLNPLAAKPFSFLRVFYHYFLKAIKIKFLGRLVIILIEIIELKLLKEIKISN